VASTQEFDAAGISAHSLQWACRQKWVTAVRRGVYAETTTWQGAGEQRRHELVLLAHQRVSPDLVASFTSAAVVLGLPTPTGAPTAPVLTLPRPPTVSSHAHGVRGGRLTRTAFLRDDEIWMLRNGLRVTSPLRTVLDCTREWDRPWGLAIADAALRHRTVSREALLAAARERAPLAGGQKAGWVAEHAREAIESPLESLARAHIVLAGFPEPTPQVWIPTRLGDFRVDLLDERHRLITEADGRLKYQHPNDLWDEKRREDALREGDYTMIRFAMEDATHPAPWLAVYGASLRSGR
jgi:hypothetical protein